MKQEVSSFLILLSNILKYCFENTSLQPLKWFQKSLLNQSKFNRFFYWTRKFFYEQNFNITQWRSLGFDTHLRTRCWMAAKIRKLKVHIEANPKICNWLIDAIWLFNFNSYHLHLGTVFNFNFCNDPMFPSSMTVKRNISVWQNYVSSFPITYP